jgi:hypothetical protein
MRVAKNRTEIEGPIRNGVADLSLNETAALLMLSSDVRELLNFAKRAEGPSGEALVNFCIANDVGVIQTPGYNPFAGRSEAEQLEWMVFTLFVSCDRAAGRGGMDPEHAWPHVEYLLQRPFQNVAEWLGEAGDGWRRACGFNPFPEGVKQAWTVFRDAHAHATPADLEAEHRGLKDRFDKDLAMKLVRRRRRERRR